MSLLFLHIILRCCLVVAGLYLLLIGLFTYGLFMLPERFMRHSTRTKRVSILVAARNEADNIDKLLSDFDSQSYPKDLFEVIIIDDRSSDDTFEKITHFRDTHSSLNLHVEHSSRMGKKAAISQALHLANNELIVTTDADCSFGENWLEALITTFEENDSTHLILGPVALSPTNTFFEKIQALEHLSLIGSTAGSASVGMPVMCNAANMAYYRSDALDAENQRRDFDIPSGDDMFLMEYLIQRYGSRSVKFDLCKDAIVTTAAAPTIGAFFKQRRRWASKAKNYTNWKILLTASTVFLFCMTMIGFFCAGFYHRAFFALWGLFVVLKTLIDYPILRKMSGFLNRTTLTYWIFPVEIIYPFYVVFTVLTSLWGKIGWR